MELGRRAINSSFRVTSYPFCHSPWVRPNISNIYRGSLKRAPQHHFFSISHRFQSDTSTSNTNDHEHFYKYTSGRWLWEEESQLKLRYRKFNVPALQQIAAKAVGAQRCESIEKVNDGIYNKVFRLVMDDGQVVVASLPYLIDGVPEFYFTASKAATMEFARTVLDIQQVPKVLAWEANADNPVGAEYILTEEARGQMMNDVWPKMDLRSKLSVIKDMVTVQKKLLSINFTRYGGLYFTKDAAKGSVPADIHGFIPPTLREQVLREYLIGPVTEKKFWRDQRAQMDIDRGPWLKPSQYPLAMAQCEIAWLKEYPNSRKIDTDDDPPDIDVPPEYHLGLLDKFVSISPMLIPDRPELVSACLWHDNFHGDNIFVEDGRITGIVGWQDLWTGPLFTHARYPMLASYKEELMLEYPDDYETLETEKKNEVEQKVTNSIMRYTYDSLIDKEVPRLQKTLNYPFQQIWTGPIHCCSPPWDEDGICRFKETLMKIQRRWKYLDTDAPMPYEFSKEELDAQAKRGESFNSMQDFWDEIAWAIDRNGWTSNSTYRQALGILSEMGKLILKEDGVDEKTRVQFQIWVNQAARLEEPCSSSA